MNLKALLLSVTMLGSMVSAQTKASDSSTVPIDSLFKIQAGGKMRDGTITLDAQFRPFGKGWRATGKFGISPVNILCSSDNPSRKLKSSAIFDRVAATPMTTQSRLTRPLDIFKLRDGTCYLLRTTCNPLGQWLTALSRSQVPDKAARVNTVYTLVNQATDELVKLGWYIPPNLQNICILPSGAPFYPHYETATQFTTPPPLMAVMNNLQQAMLRAAGVAPVQPTQQMRL